MGNRWRHLTGEAAREIRNPVYQALQKCKNALKILHEDTPLPETYRIEIVLYILQKAKEIKDEDELIQILSKIPSDLLEAAYHVNSLMQKNPKGYLQSVENSVDITTF